MKHLPKFFNGIALAALLYTSIAWLAGCAHLAPGADPLVVRVEQSEQSAKATFDLLLSTDNANRPFWATNAPQFHQLCEWFRQPQPVSPIGTNAPGRLPRAAAIIWSLDSIKQDYKAGRSSSNAVMSALILLNSSAAQAATWLPVITNAPPH